MKRLINLVSVVSILASLLAPTPALAQSEVVCESDVVVQADDWLSKIADKVYGNPLAYTAIAQATNAKAASDSSYAKIDNPDVIEAGWKLCLPSATEAQAMLGSAPAAASTLANIPAGVKQVCNDTGASPTIARIKEQGVLRVATGIAAPWGYRDTSTNQLVGFEPTTAKEIADMLGVSLEIQDYDYGLLVAGLQADKYDLVAAGLFVTEERQKAIDFSNPLVKSGQFFFTLKSRDDLNTVEDLNKPEVTFVYGTGNAQGDLAKKLIPNATIIDAPLRGQNLLYEFLTSGRADVTMSDSVLLPIFKAKYPDLKVIPQDETPLDPFDVAYGVRKDDQAWLSCINAYVDWLKSSGTFTNRFVEWQEKSSATGETEVAGSAVPTEVQQICTDTSASPTIARIKEQGVLRAATGIAAPWGYRDPATNELVGFEPTTAKEIADMLGAKLEIQDYDYSLLVAGLQADKYDLVAAGLFVTEERQKAVDFSNPLTKSGQLFFTLNSRSDLNTVEDLNRPEVTFVYGTGNAQGDLAKKLIPNAKIIDAPLRGQNLLYEFLTSERADVTMSDSLLLPIFKSKYPDLKVIPQDETPLEPFDVAYAVRKDDQAWLGCINAYVDWLKSSGTFTNRFIEWQEKSSATGSTE